MSQVAGRLLLDIIQMLIFRAPPTSSYTLIQTLIDYVSAD